MGFISDNNEAAYREEVRTLSAWCKENDLNLNTKKTKEIIIDFRKNKNTLHTELCIGGENVDRVDISEDLTWSLKTSNLIKKAQKRLFHLRTLKCSRLPKKLLINFYNCTIESVLTYGCTVWYSSCTAAEIKDLQRVVKTAQWIVGSLPEQHLLKPPPQAGLKHP